MNGLHCAFTGRLGGDAELKMAFSGKSVLRFSVAVDESTRQAEGRPEAETIWIKVACFESLAEQLRDRLTKGTPVYCEGRLKLERWHRKDGQPRTGLALVAWTVQPLGQFGRASVSAGLGHRDGGWHGSAE